MGKTRNAIHDENEASYLTQGEGEECPACRQEYQGSCPLNNLDCPCAKEEKDELDEDEKSPDFDDVDNLGAVLKDDEEADRLTEEEEEFDEKTDDDER